jgi:formamidopyrimidine-DNA glycosylase
LPELPDITVYTEALEKRILGRVLESVKLASPFLLRTVEPPLSAFPGHTVTRMKRIGKRIAIGFENDSWLVLHLMIAGRLHWKAPGAMPKGRQSLAAFHFEHGSLTLTEAGSQKRASLHCFSSESAMDAVNPGGLEPLECSLAEFAERLTMRNHTLKRALTDPRLFSGIGNSYSDEILHRARLSPVAMTQRLSPDDVAKLYSATREVLIDWIGRLQKENGDRFPEGVTAFREGMAVHGRYRLPCTDCGSPVQRIQYASNETNYCAHCQTGGRVLADRGLSQLLKEDWPRTLEELEEMRKGRG